MIHTLANFLRPVIVRLIYFRLFKNKKWKSMNLHPLLRNVFAKLLNFINLLNVNI